MDKWKSAFSNESRRRIGAWQLCIHHSPDIAVPLGELAVYGADIGRDSLEKEIHVWYNQDLDKHYRQMFDDVIGSAEEKVPEVVLYFYETLARCGVDFLPVEKHCNRYYQKDGLIFADFPFPSDAFFIVCSPDKRELCIFGEQQCLSRIMTDLQAVEADVYPVHGSAVVHHGYADCFLGNSDSGKSSVLYYLMRRGYTWLADDLLYIRHHRVYPTETEMQLRYQWYPEAGYVPDDSGKICIRLDSEACIRKEGMPMGHIYVLHKTPDIPFLQWFPNVARQSVWWLVFKPLDEELKQGLLTKMQKSVCLIRDLMKQARHVTIDFTKMQEQNLTDDYNIFKEMK